MMGQAMSQLKPTIQFKSIRVRLNSSCQGNQQGESEKVKERAKARTKSCRSKAR